MIGVEVCVLLLCLGAALADISGTNPPDGTCLCADGSGVNVRATGRYTHTYLTCKTSSHSHTHPPHTVLHCRYYSIARSCFSRQPIRFDNLCQICFLSENERTRVKLGSNGVEKLWVLKSFKLIVANHCNLLIVTISRPAAVDLTALFASLKRWQM